MLLGELQGELIFFELRVKSNKKGGIFQVNFLKFHGSFLKLGYKLNQRLFVIVNSLITRSCHQERKSIDNEKLRVRKVLRKASTWKPGDRSVYEEIAFFESLGLFSFASAFSQNW